MRDTILMPILVLVVWTLVMWVWMYATRIPAIQRAGLAPEQMQQKGALDGLPHAVRRVADNYNHLHEQPVIFYALALTLHVAGVAQPLDVGLAWAYVALRIAHSLYQALVDFVPVRFALFTLASIPLFALAARGLIAAL